MLKHPPTMTLADITRMAQLLARVDADGFGTSTTPTRTTDIRIVASPTLIAIHCYFGSYELRNFDAPGGPSLRTIGRPRLTLAECITQAWLVDHQRLPGPTDLFLHTMPPFE